MGQMVARPGYKIPRALPPAFPNRDLIEETYEATIVTPSCSGGAVVVMTLLLMM